METILESQTRHQSASMAAVPRASERVHGEGERPFMDVGLEGERDQVWSGPVRSEGVQA